MSVLEQARKTYARLKAERDGHAEGQPSQRPDCEKSEISEISPPGASSLPYVLVCEPSGLSMVAAALDNTKLVALDLETTGLNPRTDRVRLLSLGLDTIDSGRSPIWSTASPWTHAPSATCWPKRS